LDACLGFVVILFVAFVLVSALAVMGEYLDASLYVFYAPAGDIVLGCYTFGRVSLVVVW